MSCQFICHEDSNNIPENMELSFLHYVSLAFLRFCSFDGKPAVVNVFLFYV
ncbi:hypothetical protein predicted by Glimmer/Critica [Bacteroides ovatus V975]|uniref:Uncharacterized protein n=1 Tax=Bacteroides ovatus (strain ATCC 8483 / DSM 1896 / JCM 5824 / BCRC 10623 / CCUG 4943 / NCTC 11153) TaxID=411476 RepID=A0AAN3D9W4_BACO1|nr:hypothetical protein BACOVA_00474 [Bacteroides ovatus ATCC 8483]SCV06531.1 hypothetical protein predicted by Glimmer/Critica [Bacteroides ovatus V975]